ncbi:MAG: hypothetical protein AAF950_17240 [Pseudomonadota bacterium]
MEHLPDTQDPEIATTASNILNGIRPFLKSADEGQFVRGIIEDELFRHEAEVVRDPHAILALGAVGILGLVAGFFAGSL